MVYREVHLIEIKEILLRISSKDSIRKVSDSLGLHRDTIRNYINLARKHGFDPYDLKSILVADKQDSSPAD